MSFEATIQNIRTSFSTLWLRSMTRLADARTKVDNGTYNANDLAMLVGGWWVDSALFGMSFFPISDTLPAIKASGAVTMPAGSFTVRGSAYLEWPVTHTTPPASTDLLWFGDASTLPAGAVTTIPFAQVTVTPDPTTLTKIGIQIAWADPNITLGNYRGLVVSGTTPLMVIVATLY